MSLLQDALQLISTAPGALAYHLVTLFAIQLILGVAIGHWQRWRDQRATRLLVMSIGIFAARAVLMMAALFDRVGLASSDVVIPPLERFLHLITVTLTVWAFLPVLHDFPRLGTGIPLVIGLAATGTYAAFAPLWAGAESVGIAYNGYWQERVWELSTAVVITVALIASLTWRGPDYGWLVCLLALWLGGHALQLVMPVADANTPGWVRLGDLAALPLLAGLVYRRALTGVSPALDERQETTLGALRIMEAVQSIVAGDELEETLELTAPSVARTLSADVVAIGLSAPGPDEVFRIVALHPPIGTTLADQKPTLIVSEHPLLARAFQNRSVQRITGDDQACGGAALYEQLGFDVSGPLLAQPLTAEDEIVGVLLVGNPSSRREWTTHDEQIVQAIAAPLASAVASEHQAEEIPDRELEATQAEVQRMTKRAEQLQGNLERQRKKTEELVTRLHLWEKGAEGDREASVAQVLWEEEVRELAVARDALRAQLSHWRQKAQKLTQAQVDLEEQLKEMRPVVELPGKGCIGGILVGDQKGGVILATQGVQHLLGRDRAELMETPFEALFAQSEWRSAVRRLVSGMDQPGSFSSVSVNAGERLLRAELTRLTGRGRWSGRLAAILYLAEGSTAQTEKVASLVQQLYTPMTSITGYTDLLMDESGDGVGDSRSRFLARIEANVNRMESLVNALMDAADVGTGQTDLASGPVDIGEIIEDAIHSLSQRFEEKELRVHTDLGEHLPPVYADGESVHQAVHNLISNAVLSSTPGTTIDVRVCVVEHPVESNEQPSHVLVSVTDTGGGIAVEDQPYVFQRFSGASNPLIEGLGETGAGLSVAKAFIEANGGRIWVESEMDVGSTFNFTLSLTSTDDCRDSGAADEASEAQG